MIMTQICTTVEQSKNLVELGIDVNTADMYYPYFGETLYGGTPRVGDPIQFSGKRDIPAWSLSALLDLLEYPVLQKDKIGDGKTGWMVSAYPNGCRYDSDWYEDPVDACYEMIIKLHELKWNRL